MSRILSRKTNLRLASALLLGMAIAPLSFATTATAKTHFTQASITQLRNRVRLKPQNARLRKANPRDILKPGDQVATGRAAFAEFRFNEGTLARMGERAIFRFSPRSRDFSLKKGTVLLLIPPGQGKTRVRTPNVQTGIRGSALFIRHDPASKTTLVGALTDSGIEVSDLQGGPSQTLKAGQMVVAVDDEIEGFYDFDLQTFFESSPLTEGILQGEAGSDKVLEEIQAGLRAQGDFAAASSSSPIMETPSFVKLSTADEATGTGTESLGAEDGLELNPLENLASQDSSVFPGQSLGISVEADSSDTTIPPISQPPEAETPDIDPPDPEQPGPEIPEPETPDTEVPETDIPETETPELEVPETETPELEVPETETPELEVPETETPELEVPETETPELEVPETETPELEVPETETPELEVPETETPELEVPETETPELEVPETETPELEVPETETPELEVPETETPELEIPETETPELEIPETETPELEIPETETPELEIPETETPELEPDQAAGDDFPGQGNGVEGGFPGQGNGVEDGFPGQGNGVEDGFPGGDDDDDGDADD